MATVLVTGGAGFVGANLVRGLLDDGTAVRVLDDLSVTGRSLLDGLDVDLRKGSVTDAAAVRRAAKGVAAVIHLAAQSGVAPSVDHPDRDFAINVAGTFNVLDAARRAGVGHVVVASSGAVLAGAKPPLDETIALSPLSPYGASKAYAEAATLSFANVFGFTGIALRFSNVYGPHCGHKKSVVAAFLRNALQRKPLRIYGNGRQTRDFLYVDDVVTAIRAALASDVTDVYQLGTGVETSVNELAKVVAEVAGVPLRLDRRPPRPGEAARNYSDISKARRKLRWKPGVPLAEGLARTLAWMREDAEARRSGHRSTR